MGSDSNTGEENSRWWNRKCRGLNARVPWGHVISLSWLLKANVSLYSREQLLQHREGTKPCRSWAQSTTDFMTRSNLWHLLPLIIKASMRCFHGVGASWGVKQEESIQQLLYQQGRGAHPLTVQLNQIPSRGVYAFTAATQPGGPCAQGPAVMQRHGHQVHRV